MDIANLNALIRQGSEILLGKESVIKLSLCTLISRGHLLIEDLPGVGKTTLAHLLGKLIGLQYQRIQFTSDLLPADILGVSVYERKTENFKFHPGPVFSQLLLADEVNRATPKTQSALLEAMEEHQVTMDGKTFALPQPFFVIATQNPASQIGTFPLPESQLDRFLMMISIGYPGRQFERQLLSGKSRRLLLERMQPLITPAQLAQLQTAASEIFISPALLDYCQDLLAFTRQNTLFKHGLSPRAGLALLGAAKSWALIEQRDAVLPEDIQAILPSVVNHRLVQLDTADFSNAGQYIIENVPVP